MVKRQMALVWAACLVALAAGCKGRAGRGEVDAGKPDGSEMEAHLPPMQLIPPVWYDSIGQLDAHHRFTVVVWGNSSPDASTQYRSCNGVLVASDLVLTAAHCMCRPSRGETIRYDGSECDKKAEVRALDIPGEEEKRHGTLEVIPGNVIVHPSFQITLDAQGAVVASRADLAIIRLERPATPYIRPVRLATYEVPTGEVLSVVGYGYEERGGASLLRWFSQEKVQTSTGDDRLFFRSLDEASYKGDTGGPCLRETSRWSELVGISQRGLGLTPACTSIAPYQEWLEEQIQLANKRH